jgi:Solute carrier family 35
MYSWTSLFLQTVSAVRLTIIYVTRHWSTIMYYIYHKHHLRLHMTSLLLRYAITDACILVSALQQQICAHVYAKQHALTHLRFFLCYRCCCSLLAHTQQSDSALFNLSLLTSDLYGLLFAYFIEGKRLSWLYFVSFAVIVR